MIAIEKIRKARIAIQSENPFFAYLSLYLKFREAEKDELPEWGGMGVDAKGECIFRKDFVDGLSDDELKGVIVHEILHLSFLHLMRLGNRHPEAWNVACDIVVNHILKQNGFKLPKGCLEAGYNNEIEILGQKIRDIHKKTPEQIYDEFKIRKGGDGWGRGNGGFDFHKYGKELSEDEQREVEKEWNDRLTEAYVTAQQAGKLPGGVERLIGELHKSKVNWKNILRREIIKAIPSDYTYARPFKSSFSTGYYMPDVEKEMINITVGVDVSGSISKEIYADFLSEVIGMANAFRNRINIRFLTHDVDVHNDYKVENGNIEKLKKLKVDGGGGTSHKPIMEYIQEKVRNNRLAIFLTDGYSDLQYLNLEDYRFRKIFVITKNGTDDTIKDKERNQVIRLDEYDYED
jgi:predicted metal-dependent peptidase